MVGHRVEVRGADQAMQGLRRQLGLATRRSSFSLGVYLNEGVVQQEHRSRPVPGDLGVPEQMLANVTHVSNVGMAQAESPRSDQHRSSAEASR